MSFFPWNGASAPARCAGCRKLLHAPMLCVGAQLQHAPRAMQRQSQPAHAEAVHFTRRERLLRRDGTGTVPVRVPTLKHRHETSRKAESQANAMTASATSPTQVRTHAACTFCRRISIALIATITVEALIRRAPTAGDSRIPRGKATPAARGRRSPRRGLAAAPYEAEGPDRYSAAVATEPEEVL